jgi:hypothetical protein
MKVEMSPVTHGLATGAVLAVALYGASRLIEARDLLEVAIILPLLLICAPLAALHCPFLANPRMKRVPQHMHPDGAQPAAGDGILRNPGAVAVWIEGKKSKPFRVGDGVLFELGKPAKVEWYANGRTATRDEVLQSIKSGLPLLLDSIDQEPTEERRAAAVIDLAHRYDKIQHLLPAE